MDIRSIFKNTRSLRSDCVHIVKIICLVKIEAIDEGELTVEFTESDTETIDTQNATALPNISFECGEASNTGKFTSRINIGHSDL